MNVHLDLSELVGIAAFLLNVAGNLLLAWKSVWGWAVRVVSIVLWGIYAYDTASLAMMLNSITFFFINIVGFWKWRRERTEGPFHGRPRL